MDAHRDDVRNQVREHYGRAAEGTSCGCCCGGERDTKSAALRIGYQETELDSVPEEANLGLGCGNPTVLAALRAGEVVVDLGSGPGLDALLAALKVGPTGRVIGVDMTPEMLELSRRNAVEDGCARWVEFREGTIEELPVVSGSADVVISNCVINLSPDKPRVFREAFRVLRSGGRLAVSDIVLTEPLPPGIASLAAAHVACLAGAMVEDEYLGAIRDAGFAGVRWTRIPAADLLDGVRNDPVVAAAIEMIGDDLVWQIAGTVWSYRIEAVKP